MLIENLKNKMFYKLQRIMINESYDVIDIYAFVRSCLYTDQLLRDIEEKTRFRNRQSYQSKKTITYSASISASITVSILRQITVSILRQISEIVTSYTHVKIFESLSKTKSELVHEKEMIVTMSSCNLKNDLFDDDLVIESCILDDEN
jgi:hypothetical protein